LGGGEILVREKPLDEAEKKDYREKTQEIVSKLAGTYVCAGRHLSISQKDGHWRVEFEGDDHQKAVGEAYLDGEKRTLTLSNFGDPSQVEDPEPEGDQRPCAMVFSFVDPSEITLEDEMEGCKDVFCGGSFASCFGFEGPFRKSKD
jgi:hypothetical protein